MLFFTLCYSTMFSHFLDGCGTTDVASVRRGVFFFFFLRVTRVLYHVLPCPRETLTDEAPRDNVCAHINAYASMRIHNYVSLLLLNGYAKKKPSSTALFLRKPKEAFILVFVFFLKLPYFFFLVSEMNVIIHLFLNFHCHSTRPPSTHHPGLPRQISAEAPDSVYLNI